VYPAFATHPLNQEDRLYNPAIDFPIGVIYGDSDFLGSEGADEIVRHSKYFESGESQLFKLEDSGHNMMFHNYEGLTKIMIGFFKGTIKGRFELKPRLEFTPRRTPNRN
jgi:pimeloyl-ACP methyl ester carboxylesterase